MYSFGSEVIKSKILSKGTSLRVLAFGGEESPPVTTLRHWKHAECKTELYNLYGITEVSSWATCHHISEEELSRSKDCVASKRAERDECDFSEQAVLSVSLGVPLLDTLVEVRDRSGEVLTEGIGQLFIGEFLMFWSTCLAVSSLNWNKPHLFFLTLFLMRLKQLYQQFL